MPSVIINLIFLHKITMFSPSVVELLHPDQARVQEFARGGGPKSESLFFFFFFCFSIFQGGAQLRN